jgi:hypothetical protein
MAFFLGTGRCGSTLLEEVIAKHPDVGFISNLQDNFAKPGSGGKWNNAIYRRVPPGFTQKGRIRYAPSEAYNALSREVSPMIAAPVRDLLEGDVTPWLNKRLRRFFEDRASAQGKDLFVHKFTGWPRVGFVNAVFPDARFVHVVRDGRAVANSFLQMDWWQGYRGPTEWSWGPLPAAYEREWEAAERSFALLAGLEWKILIDAFERARQKVPDDRWLEIRYEDFVARPTETSRKVLDFLGLDWDPVFERQLTRFDIKPGRLDAFRKDLTPEQVTLLTSSLEEHLARFGYDA